MSIVGVCCGMDGSFQDFDTCINCHIHRSRERNCSVPVQALKDARDNHINRRGAGVSASTILACPRALYYEKNFDLYEPVISIWNKFRGTLTHALMESERDPPPWIIRERRLYVDYGGIRITGKPDDVDTKYHILTDYKSKDNLPSKKDEGHEFQFNCYAYLLRNGYWQDTDEKANIMITTIGAHYVTNKTKLEKAFKKMRYPVWMDNQVEAVFDARIPAIRQVLEDNIKPACDPYVKGYWKCDCEKYELQLEERGIPYE